MRKEKLFDRKCNNVNGFRSEVLLWYDDGVRLTLFLGLHFVAKCVKDGYAGRSGV